MTWKEAAKHISLSAIAAVTALMLAPTSAAVLQTPLPDDPRWGCYDAAPGHPTDDERRRFIAEIAPAALAAEHAGGPPATGIAAMAALEAGYGWTRTALFANNLFGWKYTSAAAAGGRGHWTLACQPASDPGKDYVTFGDHADSVTFVSGKLATNARYAPSTRRYHDELRGGVAPTAAVEHWVRGIAAAGYNPYPSYPGSVLAIARTISLSGATGGVAPPAQPDPGPAPIPQAAPNAAEAAATDYLHPRLVGARYLSQNCAAAVTDWPGYAGHEVRRCHYQVTSASKTLSAIVYLMNPSEANIAARIGYACAATGLKTHRACGADLAKLILGQNGGQFPVAGFVIERKRDAGGTGDDPVYLEFRDGVTVVTADRLNFTDTQLTEAAMDHAARAPLLRAQRYARIANADRAAYYRAGGTEKVGTSPDSDRAVAWPAVIRANEFDAQATGEDRLLNGVAMSMRNELQR